MDEHYNAYEEDAKRILAECTYMVIGTSTKEGEPWIAPVLYVYDKEYNIYFLSAVDAVHSENILKNPKVSISIFDSHQKIGISEGVQIEGRAELVEKAEIKKAITLYCEKVFPDSEVPPTTRYNPEEYLGASEFRFFKVKPANTYITGEDRRVKIQLSGK
jgi:nitroimidazol reductase NimA-like FMN-containing flavoprotein (pyridoxamine 5'-phosphate oxidase superfamily)